ncbi:MAG TPA: phosphoadenylyl-sulfate reductase [Methylomirabilota bacterium]|jgi:phosphoadenosine phosphosulfate reductase|nr:phosphoadenylyl-sulfate reductase [Methylomirabilota bacterium]
MAVRDRSQAVEAQREALETKNAEALLAWALGEFHPRIGLAASFGAEDVVLIDMLVRLEPTARVFTLDTGRLPAETYSLIDAIRERYGLAVEVYFPQADAVEAMAREHGVNLFYTSIEKRKLCCRVRKVEPLGRALRGLDAWITGLRREQAVTRAQVRKVEVDPEHGGLIKLNPLADWTSEQVWTYIRAHDVPYNALHDRGYPSIGCAPCTRAVEPGEDPRAGRWWWESADTKECGLHVTKR